MKKFGKLMGVVGVLSALMLGAAGCGSEEAKGEKGMLEEFVGTKYIAEDGSVMYFEEDGSFAWYRTDEDHEDNYYRGSYQFYFAQDGVDYIVKELPQFGLTEEKMDQFLGMNKGNEFYQLSNFCFMALDNTEIRMDGEDIQKEDAMSYYMGFYADGYYDAANMYTGNYIGFTRE